MASGISSHASSTGIAANFSDVSGSESTFLHRATPNERDSDEDRSSGAANANGVVRRVACDVCRERKVRCDKGQPHCGRCGRLGHICRYTTSRKQNASKLDISDALLTLNARLGKYWIAIHSPLVVSSMSKRWSWMKAEWVYSSSGSTTRLDTPYSRVGTR